MITENITKKVIEVLYSRKGFDDWWENIDKDIQDEITDELKFEIDNILESEKNND